MQKAVIYRMMSSHKLATPCLIVYHKKEIRGDVSNEAVQYSNFGLMKSA